MSIREVRFYFSSTVLSFGVGLPSAVLDWLGSPAVALAAVSLAMEWWLTRGKQWTHLRFAIHRIALGESDSNDSTHLPEDRVSQREAVGSFAVVGALAIQLFLLLELYATGWGLAWAGIFTSIIMRQTVLALATAVFPDPNESKSAEPVSPAVRLRIFLPALPFLAAAAAGLFLSGIGGWKILATFTGGFAIPHLVAEWLNRCFGGLSSDLCGAIALLCQIVVLGVLAW